LRCEFIESPLFTKQWFESGLDDEDLNELQLIILSDPESGIIMEGTGGLRKIRFACRDKGKSGGVRVCYVDFAFFEKVFLLRVFSKSEKSNLSQDERNQIKKTVKQLKEEVAGNWRNNEQRV